MNIIKDADGRKIDQVDLDDVAATALEADENLLTVLEHGGREVVTIHLAEDIFDDLHRMGCTGNLREAANTAASRATAQRHPRYFG